MNLAKLLQMKTLRLVGILIALIGFGYSVLVAGVPDPNAAADEQAAAAANKVIADGIMLSGVLLFFIGMAGSFLRGFRGSK